MFPFCMKGYYRKYYKKISNEKQLEVILINIQLAKYAKCQIPISFIFLQ